VIVRRCDHEPGPAGNDEGVADNDRVGAAADQLYASVQKKRQMVLGKKLNAMSYKLPADIEGDVKDAVARLVHRAHTGGLGGHGTIVAHRCAMT